MHLESYNDVKKLHDQVNVSGLRQNRVTPYKKITGNDRSMGYTHKRSDIKKGIESYQNTTMIGQNEDNIELDYKK